MARLSALPGLFVPRMAMVAGLIPVSGLEVAVMDFLHPGPGEGQHAKEQGSERDHVKVAAHQGP